MMRRFVILGRFLARSSGVGALRLGLPLYLAIAIFAVVIFAGQGLDASTLVHSAERNVAMRVVLLFAWTMATMPAARAVLAAPENVVLRSLPVPRWQILLWLGLLLAPVELPWAVLWTRGGDVVRALGATLIAMALHASVVAGFRARIDWRLLAVVAVAWLVSTPRGRLAAGVVAFVLTLAHAWQRAPEIRASRLAVPIAGPLPSALATAYALTLVRRHAAAMVRALFLVLVGTGWTAMALRNEEMIQPASALRLVLVVWIPTCIFAAATVAGPVLRTDAAAEWVLAACGTTAGQRRFATAGLLAVIGVAIGVAAGSLLGAALDLELASRLGWAARLAFSGAILSTLTEACVRRTVRYEGRDGRRIVLALTALIAILEGAWWLVAA